MKKTISICVAVALLVCMFAVQPVLAASSASFNRSNVDVGGNNTFTMDFVYDDDEAYAGVEIRMDTPDGVSLKAMTCESDGHKVSTEAADGIFWASVLNGTNLLSGKTVLHLTFEVKPSEYDFDNPNVADRTVKLTQLHIIKVEGGSNVSTRTTPSESFVINVPTEEDDDPETLTCADVSVETGKTTDTLSFGAHDTKLAGKTGTWSSSDTGVATVDADGKVTGVSEGTATIKFTTNDGTYIAEWEVTVADADDAVHPVVSDPVNVQVGGNKTLDLTGVDGYDDHFKNKTITWTSEPSGIVTVDADGKVTGVAAGTAKITGTAPDGSTVEFTVNVTSGMVRGPYEKAIYLNDGESMLDFDDLEKADREYFESKLATGTWSSSDSSMVAVIGGTTGGILEGLKLGTARITFTTDTGDIAYWDITVIEKSDPDPTPDPIITGDPIKVKIGDSGNSTLPASLKGQKGVWRSDDENVVTVDPETGEYNAVGEGEATIYFENENGDVIYYQYQITVEEGDVPTTTDTEDPTSSSATDDTGSGTKTGDDNSTLANMFGLLLLGAGTAVITITARRKKMLGHK